MKPSRRSVTIVGLIVAAEAALFLFAIVPPPFNCVMLFLNGLPLGMVFGLVLAYLEGRRVTEALSAGLCASFIVSSGVVKSVGRFLILDGGISEYWMPALTGLFFFLPLCFFVWMLNQIPAPTTTDSELRSKRTPMFRQQRWDFFQRHKWGLLGLMTTYVLLTVVRSFRDDFAVEIWQDLGEAGKAEIYAQSEMLVMFGVVLLSGAFIAIKSNRLALLSSLGLSIAGFVLVATAIVAQHQQYVEAFPYMVLMGLGMYLPYVAFHTTIFERLIATFRERGNIGYLMYLADTLGYLGYVFVILLRHAVSRAQNHLYLFNVVSLLIAGVSILLLTLVWRHYKRLTSEITSITTIHRLDEPVIQEG
jgi:hypothetical protein